MIKKSNLRALLRLLLVLVGLVTLYSLVFQMLMIYEGREHSVVTGVYWTFTTMSTLGYGDIAFESDVGRIFSVVVLLSGNIFMLVLLPFTLIQLFYLPWLESRQANKIPRRVPQEIQGHVILTYYDAVAAALINKLEQFNYPYVVILPEADEVTRLLDLGIRVMHGDLNDPDTFIRARVEEAALVATTRTDIMNTSVVFTVRGLSEETPVIATAREEASMDILRLAGTNRILNLTSLMAEALARRAIGGKKFTHVVGHIDDLVIAEVDASRTTLVGMGYNEAQWKTSVSIVGFWARGNFEVGQQESTVEENTVLVLAGSTQQLLEFNAEFEKKDRPAQSNPVIIIGGGRVGRATAAALQRRGIDYRIVEQVPKRIKDPDKAICGRGSDRSVLQAAGIDTTPTVIITPRDDQTNIYLTIFCRLLRPDVQIICRSTLERNVAALHRAGSDIVMSNASMGSNALFNLLQRSDLLMIAEGLDVFKMQVPSELAGKTLAEANIRQQTGCSVIGIDDQEKTTTNPGPHSTFPAQGEIVLIGTPEGETRFLKKYPSS